MRVLVTGGTGVVGQETVTRLRDRGHTVRLVSRGAGDDVAEWPDHVEPFAADVGDPESLRGAADECDAVIHLTGIVRESPPAATFDRVNVEGTRHVVAEAMRAGVRRFVYVSSLGADHGASDYHKSKLAAERVVQSEFGGEWSVCRLANVYGPGDEVVSLVLRWVRQAPLIPVLDDGEQEFQPIWVGDAADALIAMVERDDLAGRTLEVAGPELTSLNDLVDRIATMVDRKPPRIPIPSALASFGAWMAEKVGIELPIDRGQITMLNEGSVIRAREGNGLDLLGVRPTPLADGLRLLADSQPEQFPSDGFGALERKLFTLDVEGASVDAAGLMHALRTRLDELTPWTMDVGTEPGTDMVLEKGATVTMRLPARGTIQVRVANLTPTRLTMVTLAGHPLAGGIQLATADTGVGKLQLTILVYDKTAGFLDWVMMHPVGSSLQSHTWESLLTGLAEASGGRAVGDVDTDVTSLSDAKADEVESWFRDLIMERRRDEKDEPETSAERQAQHRPPAEA